MASTLTATQRAIFAAWWSSAGRYMLDPANPATIQLLAESAFAEGVVAIERGSVERNESQFETRYGLGGARHGERTRRERGAR